MGYANWRFLPAFAIKAALHQVRQAELIPAKGMVTQRVGYHDHLAPISFWVMSGCVRASFIHYLIRVELSAPPTA